MTNSIRSERDRVLIQVSCALRSLLRCALRSTNCLIHLSPYSFPGSAIGDTADDVQKATLKDNSVTEVAVTEKESDQSKEEDEDSTDEDELTKDESEKSSEPLQDTVESVDKKG